MIQDGWKIRVVRSRRRTIGLQIDENLVITVRAPYGTPDKYIEQFVEEKSSWIETHMQKMKERMRTDAGESAEKMTPEEIRELADEACRYIPGRTALFASRIGVDYGRITIRNQKSRWGSCSSKGNLNFNCLLMLMPHDVIDYVIVHELCHRLEMNHSPKFWQEVEKVIPDYKSRRKWLRENGGGIMKRMTGLR